MAVLCVGYCETRPRSRWKTTLRFHGDWCVQGSFSEPAYRRRPVRQMGKSSYCGADCGLAPTGGCPAGRLGGVGAPPILKFLSASETMGSDPAGAPIAGDFDGSSGG